MGMLIHGGKVTPDEARGARQGLRLVTAVITANLTVAALVVASATLASAIGHDSEHRAPAVTAVIGQRP